MEFACSNLSHDSITPWMWSIPQYFRAATLTQAAILIVFMLIGIPWNLLLIAVIVKKCLFKRPAILLLLNLAVTNLLLCVLVMPMYIIPAMAGEFIFGQSDYTRCQVCHLTLIMSTLLLMSVHNIALLSLDRFLYVKKPLQYETIVTLKRVAAILVLCWVLFTVYSILPIFGIGLVKYVEEISACALTWEVRELDVHYIYYWMYVVSACLTPVAILVVTNTWMLRIMIESLRKGYIRAKRNSIRGSKTLTSIRGKYAKDQTRILQIFIAIFVTSVVTWMPLVITISLITAADLFILEFTIFAYLCCLSQPVIHPLLQALLLKEVREVIAQFLPRCKRTSRQTSVTTLDSSNSNENSDEAFRCASCHKPCILACLKCYRMLDCSGASYHINNSSMQYSVASTNGIFV